MRPLVIFLLFITCFHLLFWQEYPGINLVVFGLASVGYRWYSSGFRKLSLLHSCLLFFPVLTGTGVLVLNSAFSMILFFITVWTAHGGLKMASPSVAEGLVNGMINFFNPRQGLVPGFGIPAKLRPAKGVLYIKVALFPVLVFFLYILLFSRGNAVFRQFSDVLFHDLFAVFSHISAPYFLFVLLGIGVVRWIIREQWTDAFQLAGTNDLQRGPKRKTPAGNMALKHHYMGAFILLVLLNALFAVVNVMDVNWVWFRFYVPENFSLKEFVHEGVGWLITALLMSIGIILFYFRGNLSFYRDGGKLKRLACLWIFQNAVLAVSVMIRTFYYIHYHGLASGRIGVLVFLALVFFGLGSLMYKIMKNRNTAFVIRVNSAFILGTLALCSLVPWSSVMVKHNLQHRYPGQVDVDYYLELDPVVYPLLYDNLSTIEKQVTVHRKNRERWISYDSIEAFENALERKTALYIENRQKRSWASFSFQDDRTLKKLSAIREKEANETP